MKPTHRLESWNPFRIVLASACAVLWICAAGTAAEPVRPGGEEAPDYGYYYIVREGDCLWTISERFYRDAYVWPQVWGQNRDILNPHWIYPGETIYLSAAPPPAGPEGRAVVEGREGGSGGWGAAAPSGTAVTTVRIPRQMADVVLVADEDMQTAGYVLAGDDGRTLLAAGDRAYLELEEPVGPGASDAIQVVRRLRTVEHPVTGRKLGALYAVIGSARVLDDSAHPVVTARIARSQDAIEVGDALRVGALPVEDLYSKPSRRELSGTVVASLRGKHWVAEHDVCFIDKGLLDGVELGDTFLIEKPGERVKRYGPGKGSIDLPPSTVGVLVVIHSEPAASTALVVGSRETFGVGSPVHAWTEQKVAAR